MRDNSNKTELYNFLANKIVKMCPNTSNTEDGVVCNHSISLEGLIHCNHKRADTQIFLHSKHIAADGNNTIMNKASDTDGLVISVSVLSILHDLGVAKLWVAFDQEQKSGFT